MNDQELIVNVIPVECKSCAAGPHIAVQITMNDFTFAMPIDSAKRLADQIYNGVMTAEEVQTERGYHL